VNHRDFNGDTDLHMAVLTREPWVMQLLLEKGADVFSVGYGDTTVLMKPFLTVDREVIEAEYLCLNFRDLKLADATISDYLRTLLDHILSLADVL
jgi:ankyrin repeat protein